MATVDFQSPGAGRLDKRITIRKRIDYPVANFDVCTDNPESFKRWADLCPVGTYVWQGSVQTGEVVTHRCVIRYRPGLDDSYEIVHDGLVYKIRRAAPLQGSNRYTVLELELMGDDEVIYGGQRCSNDNPEP